MCDSLATTDVEKDKFVPVSLGSGQNHTTSLILDILRRFSLVVNNSL